MSKAIVIFIIFFAGVYLGVYQRPPEQPCFIIPPPESISTTTLEPTP